MLRGTRTQISPVTSTPQISVLPTPIANGLAFAYAGGALVWLTLAAGFLPIAAHQRARLRAREA